MVPKIEKDREYSINELIAICQLHGRCDLAELLKNNPPPKPFVSDFCSMFPDALHGVEYGEECFFHDARYYVGGSKLMRLKADAELMLGVAEAYERAGKDGVMLAELMFNGVRNGGSDSVFDLKFEWGYGWND